MRYLHIVTSVIPSHGYYNSAAYKGQKLSSRKVANAVLEQLGAVVGMMDVEEAERAEQLERKLGEERGERERLERERELEELRRPERTPEEKYLLPTAPVFEPSAPSAPPAFDDEPQPAPPGALPPPLPPPSYDVAVAPGAAAAEPLPPVAGLSLDPRSSSASAAASATTSSISPFFSAPASYPPVRRRPPPVPMSQLRQAYLREWQDLLAAKRAFVYPLATYQGRVAAPGRCSTNGCTVIAPLIAAEHLRSEGGVSDEAVEEIIDKHAGRWLGEIRGKLGLGGAALIVPSDVHDHFVDHK